METLPKGDFLKPEVYNKKYKLVLKEKYVKEFALLEKKSYLIVFLLRKIIKNIYFC